MRSYPNRAAAGRTLAAQLGHLAGRPDLLVLALPRGGVPVAAEVAAELGVPLEVFVVRKLGVPGRPELAMGAIASGGIRVVNADVRDHLEISDAEVERVTVREEAELSRREAAYRSGRPAPSLTGRTVVIVDDGLATGASMRAAVQAVQVGGPEKIVVAVPVAPADTCAQLSALGVEVVCPYRPGRFVGVGRFYDDFTQVTDAQVHHLLSQRASGNSRPARRPPDGTSPRCRARPHTVQYEDDPPPGDAPPG